MRGMENTATATLSETAIPSRIETTPLEFAAAVRAAQLALERFAPHLLVAVLYEKGQPAIASVDDVTTGEQVVFWEGDYNHLAERLQAWVAAQIAATKQGVPSLGELQRLQAWLAAKPGRTLHLGTNAQGDWALTVSGVPKTYSPATPYTGVSMQAAVQALLAKIRHEEELELDT